jgi:prepilin-type N-terminal cleavage/methylation domain-containing protein
MKKTPGQAVGADERGFSLIELLIAMVVTLIVSGAVLMLLVQANRSFQTQPEMTERQQNIRVAMDLIMRDVANAGAGLPQQVQVFTAGLDGRDPPAPDGESRDRLEMLTNETGRDPLPGCATVGATVPILPMNVGVTLPASVLVLQRDAAGVTTAFGGPFKVNTVTNGAAACGTVLALNGVPPAGATSQVMFVSRVLYYIAPDPDDPAMPVLWRQVGGAVPGAVDPKVFPQQVARGIENMQVTYRHVRGITTNPTADSCFDPDCSLPDTVPDDVVASPGLPSLTVEVQVVLAARGGLIQPTGRETAEVLTPAADGTSAYRGSLRSRAAPRAALMLAGGAGLWQ